jgi:hypothetical protein
MGTVRRHVTIYDAVAAETGSWVALDARYDDNPVARSLRVHLEAGDTLTLQAIVKDVKGIDKSFLDSLLAADITTLKIYTASEADTLDGGWTYIRAIKSGTAGRGVMEGIV